MRICTWKASCPMHTDMTKLTLTFCNFTNAPYKPNQTLQYSNVIYICRLVRSNAFVFYFMQLTNYTRENFTELCYNFPESTVISSVVSIFINALLCL